MEFSCFITSYYSVTHVPVFLHKYFILRLDICYLRQPPELSYIGKTAKYCSINLICITLLKLSNIVISKKNKKLIAHETTGF